MNSTNYTKHTMLFRTGNKNEALRYAKECRQQGEKVKVLKVRRWIATCDTPVSRAGGYYVEHFQVHAA